MSKESAEGLDVSDKDKAVINYWFRHIWELAWPLYPGMILGSALCNMPIFKFISYTAPGTIACVLLGYFFFLRPSVLSLEAGVHDSLQIKPGGVFKVFKEGLPLIVAICGALFFEGVLSVVYPGTPFEIGVILALALAVMCAAFANAGSAPLLFILLCQKRFLSMLFMIVCVFVFKDILGACGLVGELSRLAGGEAALIVAAVLVPFLIGFIAGITLAFVGAAMPLVVGLVDTMGLSSQLPAWAMLCMFSGFAGLMASPLHICFLLTCEYFKVDLYEAWKRVLIPSLVLLSLGVAYFFVLV
jgi:integral membrane protein (TIGR00529 family)